VVIGGRFLLLWLEQGKSWGFFKGRWLFLDEGYDAFEESCVVGIFFEELLICIRWGWLLECDSCRLR
jgi:hypothetical protein